MISRKSREELEVDCCDKKQPPSNEVGEVIRSRLIGL
jgi:hypothetical protein